MCPCLASTKWWTLLRPHLGGMGLATTFVFQGLMFPVLLEDLINLILICHVFECTDASVCVRVSECFSLQDTVCKFGLMPVCNRPICTIYSTPRRDGVLGFFVEPKVHNLHDLKNYSHSCHQYAWMHPENSLESLEWWYVWPTGRTCLTVVDFACPRVKPIWASLRVQDSQIWV